MATKTGQRGRPTKPARQGEKTTLSLRVTPELKQRIEDAGAPSGRNLSQEAERRLENSFRGADVLSQSFDMTFGPQAAGLIILLSRVVRDTGPNAGFMTTLSNSGADNWLNDPYAFDQVSVALSEAIGALRPEGSVEPPRMPAGPPGLPDVNKTLLTLGRDCAKHLLEAVTGKVRSFGGSDGGLAQWAAPVRDRLGTAVIERIKKSLGKNQHG